MEIPTHVDDGSLGLETFGVAEVAVECSLEEAAASDVEGE